MDGNEEPPHDKAVEITIRASFDSLSTRIGEGMEKLKERAVSELHQLVRERDTLLKENEELKETVKKLKGTLQEVLDKID